MTERILPASDVFATCPNDGKILEYYTGVFEAVYVLLHPFIKPVSIEKDRFNPNTYPTRSEVVKNCEAISWKKVAEKAALPSIAAVDIGLRTRIRSLKAEFSNQLYADKINGLIESDNLLPAPEGFYSDFLYDKILSRLQDMGHKWVWIGDEFGTERKLHWIEDLKEENPGLRIGHWNIFTPNKEILWATHWDSHFSLLCSSKNIWR